MKLNGEDMTWICNCHVQYRQMQKECTFPQVDALKWKCGYNCHATCMLPSEMICEQVAPPQNNK